MVFCDFPMIIVFVLLLVFTSNSKLELDDGFRCFDEIDVLLRNSYCVVHEIFQFYVKYFLFPTLNFISSSVINLDLSFEHDINIYIWLLFLRFDSAYEHTVYGLRSFKCFRRSFFVRGAGAARFVLTFLLFTCVFDTSNLVSGPCSPSLWTILMTPCQLFAVKGLPTWNTTFFLTGLVNSAELTMDWLFTVSNNENIISMIFVIGCKASGKTV